MQTTDGDGDGYTPEAGDCDDADAAVHPGAKEVCTDSVDNDRNGMTDSNDYNCMTPCEKAAYDRSSVGCVYYGVDTNALGGPYAIAVSNVDSSAMANVVIEQKSGATWAAVSGGTFVVGPKSVKTLTVPRRFVDGTRDLTRAARIASRRTFPVISYQFAPIDGSASFLSDASLLLPVSALDKYYIVSAWPYGADVGDTPRPSHIQIAAAEAAQVTVTSPVASSAGASAPAVQPGTPQTYSSPAITCSSRSTRSTRASRHVHRVHRAGRRVQQQRLRERAERAVGVLLRSPRRAAVRSPDVGQELRRCADATPSDRRFDPADPRPARRHEHHVHAERRRHRPAPERHA